MEDFVKSVKAFLYDRSSSPLLGAIVLSAIAWNYRILLIVFSGTEVSQKLQLIDNYLSQNLLGFTSETCSLVAQFPYLTKLTNSIFIPVVIALTYLYVYPKVAKPVYRHSLEKQKEIRELKQAASDERLYTAKEWRQLFNQHLNDQRKHDGDIRQLNEKVGVLETRNNELHEQNQTLNEELSAKKELESENEKLKSEISSSESRKEFFRDIFKLTPFVPKELIGDSELEKVILSKKFVLHHNPSKGLERKKTITFHNSGVVGEGSNEFEHRWKIENGLLELIQKDGAVHSRFFYLPKSLIFISTDESSLPAAKGQFIVADSELSKTS